MEKRPKILKKCQNSLKKTLKKCTKYHKIILKKCMFADLYERKAGYVF